MAETFPGLPRPPINEVICGFYFEQPLQISPVTCGLYWAARKSDFPKHEVKEFVADQIGSVFFGPIPPVRTWLVSESGTRLVQIQHDRFYVNWRRQNDSDAYPRFRAKSPQEPLLPFALREWKAFSEFAASQELEATVSRIELCKIDVFRQDLDWKDQQDLVVLLPVLGPFFREPVAQKRDVLWQYTDTDSDGRQTTVVLASGIHNATKKPVIRLETRVRTKIRHQDDNLHEEFVRLDDVVDSAFFGLIPNAELKRFKAEE